MTIDSKGELSGEENSIFKQYEDVNKFLQGLGMNPILYGSVGASVYLGQFKTFEDLDLLVEDEWLSDRWQLTIKAMKDKDFNLINEQEHEFENSIHFKVALAAQSILQRDGISTGSEDVVIKDVENVRVRTLTPDAFLRAYQFSAKDGYRAEKRGKKDVEIISKMQDYIKTVAR